MKDAATGEFSVLTHEAVSGHNLLPFESSIKDDISSICILKAMSGSEPNEASNCSRAAGGGCKAESNESVVDGGEANWRSDALQLSAASERLGDRIPADEKESRSANEA